MLRRSTLCYLWLYVSSVSQEGGVRTVGMSMCVSWERSSTHSLCLLGTMAVSPVWPIISRAGGTVYSLPSWEQKYCSMWHRGQFYLQPLIWHLFFWNSHYCVDLCPFRYEVSCIGEALDFTVKVRNWKKTGLNMQRGAKYHNTLTRTGPTGIGFWLTLPLPENISFLVTIYLKPSCIMHFKSSFNVFIMACKLL